MQSGGWRQRCPPRQCLRLRPSLGWSIPRTHHAPNWARLRVTANCSATPRTVRVKRRLSAFSIFNCCTNLCCSGSASTPPNGLGSARSAAGRPPLAWYSNGPMRSVRKTSATPGTTSPFAGPFGAAAANNLAKASTNRGRATPLAKGRSTMIACACRCNSKSSGEVSPLQVEGSAQSSTLRRNLIMAQMVRSCTTWLSSHSLGKASMVASKVSGSQAALRIASNARFQCLKASANIS
mmetsp:Transcript_45261/g.114876  ORF Transcript_45261/g.114876 Transcript_45261/m.114876 type:complete len:237 (+) Transcript_45261:39-749(+)